MGGHQQFGEFHTLEEATKAFHEAVRKYGNEHYLWLRYAQITFDEKDHLYKLAMRFSK